MPFFIHNKTRGEEELEKKLDELVTTHNKKTRTLKIWNKLLWGAVGIATIIGISNVSSYKVEEFYRGASLEVGDRVIRSLSTVNHDNYDNFKVCSGYTLSMRNWQYTNNFCATPTEVRQIGKKTQGNPEIVVIRIVTTNESDHTKKIAGENTITAERVNINERQLGYRLFLAKKEQ